MRALALAAALWSAGGAAWADTGAILPPSDAWVTISTEELRARYDMLWAISDVHGRLGELEQLLVASGLCVNQAGRIAWNRERSRQILLVVGDLLNGGKESVGVVLLLEGLQPEAAAAGSRLVVLMGNHEVEFLANPALA
ncbi:MAG TPA: metallophosphoesterase, partial [Myxococcales bacterium]